MGAAVAKPPRIFNVNWFRTDANGKFAWPGFGQNMRVLQWIVERCRGRGHAVETPLGIEPAYTDLNWTGLEFPPERFAQVMRVDKAMWAARARGARRAVCEARREGPAALAAERARLGGRPGALQRLQRGSAVGRLSELVLRFGSD